MRRLLTAWFLTFTVYPVSKVNHGNLPRCLENLSQHLFLLFFDPRELVPDRKYTFSAADLTHLSSLGDPSLKAVNRLHLPLAGTEGLSIGELWSRPSSYTLPPHDIVSGPHLLAEVKTALDTVPSGVVISPLPEPEINLYSAELGDIDPSLHHPARSSSPSIELDETSSMPPLESDTPSSQLDEDLNLQIALLDEDGEREKLSAALGRKGLYENFSNDCAVLRDYHYRDPGSDERYFLSDVELHRQSRRRYIPRPARDYSHRYSSRRGWRFGYSVVDLMRHLFYESVDCEEGIACCIQALNDIELGHMSLSAWDAKAKHFLYHPQSFDHLPADMRRWHGYVRRLIQNAARFSLTSEHLPIMEELAAKYASWAPGVRYTIPSHVIGLLNNRSVKNVVNIVPHYAFLEDVRNGVIRPTYQIEEFEVDGIIDWSDSTRASSLVSVAEFWELFIRYFRHSGWGDIVKLSPQFPSILPSSHVWTVARLL
nr:MAG: VP8 [Shelly headland virus]